jgi:glycosyltransferase involved in cell wall biosynthesis
MVDNPLVSVVMPVYNGRRYVREAVDSVLAQTFLNFEFIIVDDGSTDGTSELLQSYADRDPRIRLLSRGHAGLGVALNEGLAVARATYIARMDADDISLPERFQRQVDFLQAHPDHVLAGCRCILIDPDGHPICEKREIEFEHSKIEAMLLKMKWPVVHPAVMMRRDVVMKIGGYHPELVPNEDHDLFLRLSEVGKLANLDEVLLYYRQHFHSVGFTSVDAQVRTVLATVVATYRRRGIPVPEDLQAQPQLFLKEIDHRRNWAWWALAEGNLSTARRHALAVFRSAPLSKASWWAMFCAIRGH